MVSVWPCATLCPLRVVLVARGSGGLSCAMLCGDVVLWGGPALPRLQLL